MNQHKLLEEYRKRGVIMDGARVVLANDEATRQYQIQQFAYDAALQTAPNAGVPVEFTYFLDPRTFEIPVGPYRAQEVFTVRQFGDWTTSDGIFAYHEVAGKTAPYSDLSNTPEAYANYTWPRAQNYVFQTNIYYGLREQELMGQARINYASSLQRSAYLVIEQDMNKFWLLGIAGMNIYGALNDPNLPNAIATANNWTNPATAPEVIASDYRLMYQDLAVRSNGFVTQNSPLVLLVSPSVSVGLGANSQYNQTARDLIEKFTPNLTIEVIPELEGLGTGGTAFLIAREIAGQPTADLGASVRFQAGSVVQRHSTLWTQKVWAGTYGALYYFPWGVSRLTGVEG